MKSPCKLCHVNRTTFQRGLRFQTGLSSLRVSCKRALICLCWFAIIKYLHFRLISLSALCLYFFILFEFLASLTKLINCLPWSCLCFQKHRPRIFANLFLKIYPLFGQIVITCLKCSRASFCPSSYSEKMRWGRGCKKNISTRKQKKWTASLNSAYSN